MSTLDRLRAIANRAGSPTITYSPENEREEQRNSLDWIAHEAAEAIKELVATASEPNALELGAAVRQPICMTHGTQMHLIFFHRPGGAPGNNWVCRQCMAEKQAQS